MSLQKEKGLAPQKKNLKLKRESEASGAKAQSMRNLMSELKLGPPKDQNLSTQFQIGTTPSRVNFYRQLVYSAVLERHPNWVIPKPDQKVLI